MALTEKRVLKSVEILPTQSAINVQWTDQILRDGEVISEQPHRKAYAQEQAGEFAEEVEGAADYMAALGWQ